MLESRSLIRAHSQTLDNPNVDCVTVFDNKPQADRRYIGIFLGALFLPGGPCVLPIFENNPKYLLCVRLIMLVSDTTALTLT